MEDSDDTETKTFYGRCLCCMEYGYMKDMWTEHSFEGEREVYGEMIMETFSIVCNQPDKMEHICEMCIMRLRESFSFKKEVQTSLGMLLDDYISDESDLEESKPIFLEDFKMSDHEDNDIQEPQTLCKIEPEYEEIEYLEEDEAVIATELMKPKLSTEKAPVKKWPKKKKKSGDLKTKYKNYTESDMRKCIEAVLQKKLSTMEASKKYNVPRKTISARLTYMKSKPDSEENENRQQFLEKQFKFIEETKIILTYTNAVPFKVKRTRLCCAFCDPSPIFESPEDLRPHTLDKHKHQILSELDSVLRPHWMNEVIRIDIENLQCEECSSEILGWNDLFQHLNETHNIDLDEAYTRVIPFKLTSAVQCALCSMTFQHFHFLDSHMNAHYNNYVCAECGDGFVSECRLKKHRLIHSNEKYPCNECGKVFTLKKYRQKHINFVHKHEKLFKCLYCDERYSAEHERHLHVVEKHNEKVKSITCEYCGVVFTWRPYYMAHIRKKHNDNKKYKCLYCMKSYVSNYDLKMHVMRHTGEKRVECEHCDKKFVTKAELRSHARTHKNLITVMETPPGLVVIRPAFDS